jgi:hypothetical protein
MRMILAALCSLFLCVPALAEAPAQGYELRAGTSVQLVTTEELSSKTSRTGDIVHMETKSDLRVNGTLVIPAGTKAMGKVADAMAKGAFGQSGKLLVEPMYIRLGDNTIRLSGKADAKGTTSAGAYIGMALITPGFTGKSAIIPAGSELNAEVRNDVMLPGTTAK